MTPEQYQAKLDREAEQKRLMDERVRAFMQKFMQTQGTAESEAKYNADLSAYNDYDGSLWKEPAPAKTQDTTPLVVQTISQEAYDRMTANAQNQLENRVKEIQDWRASQPLFDPASSPYDDVSYVTNNPNVPDSGAFASASGRPTQWGNIYQAIQTGQAQIKDVPTEEGGTTKALVWAGSTYPASVTEVAPNVYSIRSTSGQYSANFVVAKDKTTDYVEPIKDINKQYQQYRHDYSGGGLSGALSSIDPTVLAIAISFVAPGVGSAIAAELGVSSVVGTAIASAAMNIAAGTDPSTAIQNAVTSAVVQTGSASVATEINSALSNLPPETAASISNAAGSALSSAAITAARGGSTQDIINNAVAGAAGSAVSSETGDKILGAATTGGLTGGLEGAAIGAAGAYARLPSVEDKQGVPVDQIAATEAATPVTSSQTGGVEPVSRPPEAVSAPVEGVTTPPGQVAAEPTPVEPVTPTPPAPQEIPIPDQSTRDFLQSLEDKSAYALTPLSGEPGLKPGELSPSELGQFDYGFTTVDTPTEGLKMPTSPNIDDMGGGQGLTVKVPGGEVSESGFTAEGTLPALGDPESFINKPPPGEDIGISDTTAKPTYKPEFFVAGGVTPRMTTRPTTLTQTLQAPFFGPSTTSGLTSYRGAGEIESSETGGKRRNVWNEASLRLKDALGI